MSKSPTPNTAYFKPVLFTDPTYGHTYPVFLLCSDEKNVFYTSIAVFQALKISNSLERVKEMFFSSPFREETFHLMTPESRRNVFFCDSIDLNWFYYDDCLFRYKGEDLEVSKNLKNNKQSIAWFHYTTTDVLKHPGIHDHLSLLHIFCSHFFSDDPSPWKRDSHFVSDFINHKMELFTFFKDDAFYYLKLYELFYARPNELDKLLLQSLFGPTIQEQRIANVLQDYKNT